MAKKKAKKSTKKSGSKEVLVVASKVKAYIKEQGCMTSGEAIEALNDKVYELIDAACARTEANKRSTVKPQDL
jgi:histone H3/H4